MSEPKRKLVRLAALIFPALYLFLPKIYLVWFSAAISLIFLALEILRLRFPSLTEEYFRYFPWFAKERERTKIAGITWMAWGIFAVLLIFDKHTAVIAILFTVFGDAVSSLARYKFEKIKVFGKGLEGSLAVFAACFLIGFVFSRFWRISFLAVVSGSLIASLVELLPLRIGNFYIDDNFSVALVSGFAIGLLS